MSFKSKQRIVGAIILLVIEIGSLVVGLMFFRYFYAKITVSKGTVEVVEDLKLEKNISDNVISTDQISQNNVYNGIFGSVIYSENQPKSNIFDYVKKTNEIVKVDYKTLYKYKIVQNLIQKYKIDYKLANALLETQDIDQVLSDIYFLSKHTTHPIARDDIANDKILLPYQYLIIAKKYNNLIFLLKQEEITSQNLLKQSKTNPRFLDTDFVNTEGFVYIYDKFIKDDQNLYKNNVTQVAKILDIDANLIFGAIGTEQIRGFFTYRGVAKNLIGDNWKIMSMAQGSLGIGGVKIETARQAQSRLKSEYPEIYAEYIYQNDKEISDEVLVPRLEDSQNYFFQVLYVGVILKNIIETRKIAGQDISKQPGIILTLYNIGNKTPNTNPAIGGAEITINKTKYTFGGLGMRFYYRNQIYGIK